MALTQTARLAGPSWDEEVVPALRKRLESESRTLARRMSAISLSSVEDLPNATFPDKTMRQTQASPPASSALQSSSSGAQRQQAAYQRQPTSDRTTPMATNRVNGGASTQTTTKTAFQRARTYSTPYASDLPNGQANGQANGHARPDTSNSQSSNPARSLSPRPVDIKPTRIPKASRPPISSAANSPQTNGFSHSPAVTPFSLSPEQPFSQILSDQRGYAVQKGIVPSSSTQSTFELSNRNTRPAIGLLNESPPFPTDSTMSSGFTQNGNHRNASLEETAPRASTDSEERPYEHWYRGEVSRNGGVGELRVGRRQEMLDIANYGHLIESRKNNSPAKRLSPMNVEADTTRRSRKRAGSIAGITTKERERESIYLDEEHVDDVARVLDEHPLTDLDGEGEGSEVQSLSEGYGGVAYAYIPSTVEPPSSEWTTVAGAHERSTTPTPSMLPRPSSRQQQGNIPPTRIPGPSSRRSSESRSTATTSPAIGGTYANTNTTNLNSMASSSRTPTASPPTSSFISPSSSRQLSANPNPATNTPQKKRGISPGAKKTPLRGQAAKAIAKSKTAPGRQQQEQDNRGSVAYYPTPAGDGEDMADAIPSWTQPVPKEGNWDEVVLPVVARKKGLDGHYEEADGSPKPKKMENAVAPAPGTFGFDGTKYRPPRNGDFTSIPMDEFGRAANKPEEQPDSSPSGIDTHHTIPQAFDDRRKTSPSPAPFADYAPPAASTTTMVGGVQMHEMGNGRQQKEEEEEGGAGCCKCVVM